MYILYILDIRFYTRVGVRGLSQHLSCTVADLSAATVPPAVSPNPLPLLHPAHPPCTHTHTHVRELTDTRIYTRVLSNTLKYIYMH